MFGALELYFNFDLFEHPAFLIINPWLLPLKEHLRRRHDGAAPFADPAAGIRPADRSGCLLAWTCQAWRAKLENKHLYILY